MRMCVGGERFFIKKRGKERASRGNKQKKISRKVSCWGKDLDEQKEKGQRK